MKFDTRVFFAKSVEEIKISLKSAKNGSYFAQRLMCVYVNISAVLIMNHFQAKFLEKISTHILYSVTSYRKSCYL